MGWRYCGLGGPTANYAGFAHEILMGLVLRLIVVIRTCCIWSPARCTSFRGRVRPLRSQSPFQGFDSGFQSCHISVPKISTAAQEQNKDHWKHTLAPVAHRPGENRRDILVPLLVSWHVAARWTGSCLPERDLEQATHLLCTSQG